MYVNLISSPFFSPSQYNSWNDELSTATTCSTAGTEVDTLRMPPDMELNDGSRRASWRSMRTNLPPLATNSIISPTRPMQDCPFLVTTTQSFARTSKDPRSKLRTWRVAYTDRQRSTSAAATLVIKVDCAILCCVRSNRNSDENA